MMHLAQAAEILYGSTSAPQVVFEGVSTDSRTIARGQLFVALRGERHDGHAYLAAVARAGAAAAMVDARSDAAIDPGGAPLPLLVVEDTRLSLGRLAQLWRAQFSPVLVGIAGSNGKTTAKEMLASILRCAAREDEVLATAGNLNNDIGLPLTLLRMRAGHRWCAIELGMNHKGEIARLARIARPTIALVTNAQREHLEFMGSVAEVAEENADLYRALGEDGIAVINADDAHAGTFRQAASGQRIVDFSLERGATVTGRYRLAQLSCAIRISCPAGEAEATLAIPGAHNVMNALAAAACAHAAGIAPAAIAAGLAAFRPYIGRLQVKAAPQGATVIDDSYNANPDSVRAAIDVLAAAGGHTVLVLGDMGEVGDEGPDFHSEIGRYARERGVGSLLALGESTAHTVAAYGQGARHYATAEDLLGALAQQRGAGVTILVKGSRFMRMERIVAALCGQVADASGANSAEVH